MANPRIEEVDDDEIADDPEEMDLDAFDFARPQGMSLGQPSESDAPAGMSPEAMQALLQGQNRGQGQAQASSGPRISNMPQMSDKERERLLREQQERSKNYQCIYPVYFDSTRSREEGRRVGKEDAVPNPLAREIADALAYIASTYGVDLRIVLEPTKTHPKDWANPGRVKALVKKGGKPATSKVSNKRHLYKLIADYLKSHPTTEDTPKRLQIQGIPMPKEKIAPPAIPRGSKIGTILPLHSPALTGGGVSDNFLKDMMAEMGGQLPPGMAGMAGMGNDSGASQPQKKVKDKKKK